MIGDWKLTVTGTIVKVEERDVDKTGRHKKFFYAYLVQPDSMERPPGDVKIPSPVPFTIKDQELPRLTTETLAVGDRVVMSGNASGPAPASFYLTSIKKLAR